MSMIRKSDLAEIAKQQGSKLDRQIKNNNFPAIQDTMNFICRTVTFDDEFINDEFINAIVKEVYGEYGSDLLIAAERGYPVNYEPMAKDKRTVTKCNGKTQTIETVTCNNPYASDKFTQFYDTLDVSDKKVLTVTITQAELRSISCGEETFNKLRELVLSKIAESMQAWLRDRIYCLINDSTNYKEIVDIIYSCEECDGINFISELTKFAINLQVNAEDYNIAGRVYDLNIKNGAFLLSSTDLASRLASRYAQGGTNASYIDVASKFSRVFDIPQLTISDGIIIDKRWIQVRKVFEEIVWKYEPLPRAECGVYNLDLKIKPINFFVAAPFRLVAVSKEDKTAAEVISKKIKNLTKTYTITNQTDAETQIKADIDKLNSDGKLTLEYTFSDFVLPTETDGSINVKVLIKNQEGTNLSIAKNSFVLKKK